MFCSFFNIDYRVILFYKMLNIVIFINNKKRMDCISFPHVLVEVVFVRTQCSPHKTDSYVRNTTIITNLTTQQHQVLRADYGPTFTQRGPLTSLRTLLASTARA